jgi:ATP-dependent exoDNAse (exonuclease V) alpha subunit
MMKEHIKTKNVNDVVYPLKKDKDCQSQDVLLCRGMPVISCVNNGKYDVCSNETFTIKKILYGEVYLVNEYAEVQLELSEFQKIFNVAFAITADKSQGSTFHDPYKIHEWNLMDKHRRYTAVTRGTKIENLFFA